LTKARSSYVCGECGASFPRWSGRCPNCDQWDTLQEVRIEPERALGNAASAPAGRAFTLSEVPGEDLSRIRTGIGELDRAMGGGVLPGGTVLLAGDPGIGKSTILLQALARMASDGARCIYVTCEESLNQIKLRAERLALGGSPMLVASETSLQPICSLLAAEEPQVAVVDSVQMVQVDGLDAPLGSLRHLKASASELIRQAKRQELALFLVGHMTKEGAIAGPKVLEHMVDTVLYFESERFQALRILRATKNRFGSVDEIGVFEMGEAGMRDVANPSELFLAERDSSESGSVVAATVEGNRALLVEIQALVAPSAYGTPERKASGIDYRRFGMMLAVLERRAGLSVCTCDAFVNVAGGVRVMEPAVDLPIALAIASAARDLPFPPDAVAIGEVGLGGEVRAVSNVEKRLREAEKLGFQRAFLAHGNAAAAARSGVRPELVRHLRQAVGLLERG